MPPAGEMYLSIVLLLVQLVTTTIVCITASSALTGGFSFSSQLTTKKRKAIEDLQLILYEEKVYGGWSKESEEFSLNASGICDDGLESSTLLQIVQRVLKGSGIYVDQEDKSKTSLDMNICMIELPLKFVGKSTFVLKNAKKTIDVTENIDEDSVIELEYWSPKVAKSKTNKIKDLPTSLRLKVQIMLQGGELTVSVQTSSTGLSKSTITKIMKVTRKFWQTRLDSEVQVAIARLKQLKSQSMVSKSAEKLKNAKRLDRIAYPEKYKQQSPSVRKEGVTTYSSSSATSSGSSGGSGRYKPGAAAAARQVMRKGG